MISIAQYVSQLWFSDTLRKRWRFYCIYGSLAAQHALEEYWKRISL